VGGVLIADPVTGEQQNTGLPDLPVQQHLRLRHRLKFTALLGQHPQRFSSSNHPPPLHRLAISAADR